MYCKNCGQPLSDGARFCENCGSPVDGETAVKQEASAAPAEAEKKITPKQEDSKKKRRKKQIAGAVESGTAMAGQKVTENIYLCPDGKYRWIYEYQMLKNPTILFTVMKVLLLSFGIVLGFLALINLIGGDFRYWTRSDYLSSFRAFLILLLVFLALGVISYLILASIYGWSYQVLFTMDEDGVELKQMQKDFKKSQAVGWLTAAAGLAAGSIGRAGTGILAAARDSSVSVFKNVRKVKAVRRRHVIYVNQLLDHNQVYAEDADFDFVEKYILDRCTNIKKKTV